MLQRVNPSRLDTILAGLDDLLAELRTTAVERDRVGGHPAAEKELLRQCGLLLLSVPEEFGGVGADWPTVLHIVRRIATVDSAAISIWPVGSKMAVVSSRCEPRVPEQKPFTPCSTSAPSRSVARRRGSAGLAVLPHQSWSRTVSPSQRCCCSALP